MLPSSLVKRRMPLLKEALTPTICMGNTLVKMEPLPRKAIDLPDHRLDQNEAVIRMMDDK